VLQLAASDLRVVIRSSIPAI